MCLCRRMDIRLLALVAVGGAIGASLRYSVQSSFEPDSGPYATAGVNLLGSLLLGSIFGAIAAGTTLSDEAMAGFATGILGSFTTMSAFAMDYLEFSEESNSTAFAYAFVTITGSIGLAWAGYRTTLELMS
ncbi:MAG TPA: fluoride efflux transporter CrcB [Candidatus Poseidoniales archaeon]|nr:fluoride efflux transporter CrcB [Euryarchaeota archaeon]DAC30500.1 MAG TPA: fluoride efflux transporter CrcB [Candidatus Poseidoniales archaeon]